MQAVLLGLGLAAWAAQPQDCGKLIESGRLLYPEERFAEAETLLRKAAACDGGSFQVRLLLAATLVSLHRPGDAIDELLEARRLNPKHADAIKLLALQYLAVDRPQEAVALLAPQTRSGADEEFHLLLIEAYQDSGESSRALEFARLAVQRFPSSAQLHCWFGFQLEQAGRFEEAKALLEKAIRLDPNFEASYSMLGDLLLKEQRYSAAGRYFRAAIERKPNSVEARIGLSRTLLALGDTAGALAGLEEAVRVSPGEARIHLELSQLYSRAGSHERAAQEAARYRELKRAANESAVPEGLRYTSKEKN